MMMEIYLDNSATTKPYLPVVKLMVYNMKNFFGNPSSLHAKGIMAEKLIKKAKNQISEVLRCSPNELFFTSGGTESNNLAIQGIVRANRGKHILSTQIEHPATLNTLKYLESIGYEIEVISVDSDGVVVLEEIENKIKEDTVLVTVMHANNEIGTIEPILKIAKLIRRINSNTYFHVDACQSYCKIPFTVDELGCDLLSISSHKIHGPKGVGCLYVRGGTRVSPIIFGGGQQKDLRPGTENVVSISAFGLASEISGKNMLESSKKMRNLNNLLRKHILKNIDNVFINTPLKNFVPHILNVSFKGVKSQVLLNHLDKEFIYVSSGAACSSRKNKPSYVLGSIGLSPDLIESSIRFSLSVFTTIEEIERTILCLTKLVPKLRRIGEL
ncbi:MAG: cysteine desulfurase [Clostridiales bacterium]|jgi:cysteine desulfurase|nr:cysteine desulfurase [Clostridiales bacterium]